MREALVRDIYRVDTISKGNGKAWMTLMNWVRDNLGPDEQVQFDFKGIELINPWLTPEFNLFMQDKRIYMKIWNNQDTANTINIMCTMNDNTQEVRAVNVVVPVQKKLTKEELAIIAKAQELQQYFEINGNNPKMAVLHIHKRFDQIGVPITISYIEAAMKQFAKEHGVTKIRLDAIGISIQSSVIKNLTNLIKSMEDEGVELEINSTDEEVMNKVNMYQSLDGNEVTSEKDRVRIIKALLHNGKVGMLIKYRDSRAADEFGRRGKGKPISCRVAIYRGLKREKDGIHALITTFNGKTFYTRTHWSLEKDNEILSKLDTEELSIPVEQLGVYNSFLGSHYHLVAPIQKKVEDTMTMYSLDENHKIIRNNLTIPERIKVVLDDWGISYDRESLQMCIQQTKDELGM